MTLKEWLAQNGVSVADFAADCGVHPITVYKWMGGTMPQRRLWPRIQKATAGQIGPASFLGSQASAEASP